MGFASSIGMSSSGNAMHGAYSLWDLHLVNADDKPLIRTNPSQTGTCCQDYTFDTNLFSMPDGLWYRSCSEVRFNTAGMPSVNGEYPVFNQESFTNKLSHLDNNCGGGGPFVMNYSIKSGITQRALSDAEVSILCKLGYKIPGNCDAGCFVMAVDEAPFIYVFSKPFFNLPDSAFMSNDVVLPGTEIAFPQDCGDNSLFQINHDVIQRFVELKFANGITPRPGLFDICYTLTDCGGRICDRGKISLLLTDNVKGNPGNLAFACDPASCGLICNGDFEAYFPIHSVFHTQAGMIAWNDGSLMRRRGLETSDNAYIPGHGVLAGWGTWNQNDKEVFSYPLNRPIKPGCTATIRFKSAQWYNRPMRIIGFNKEPCENICFPRTCSDSVKNVPLCSGLRSICMQEIPASAFGTPSPRPLPISFFAWLKDVYYPDTLYPYPENRGKVSVYTR